MALDALATDLSTKVGPDGIILLWQLTAANLANRMGTESYMGWPSFNAAIREGRTAFSIESEIQPLIDMALTDVDGDVIGYLYATRNCCYLPTLARIKYLSGSESQLDAQITEAYNTNFHNIAWCSLCVFHERFREEAAKDINVSGEKLRCLLLGTRSYLGEIRTSQDNLGKLGINEGHVRALLRNFDCIFAIIMAGAKLREEGVDGRASRGR